MNRTLIYIGESLLDLFPKALIAITYQFADIRDLAIRRISYSSTIELPPTENNTLLLGSPQQVQSESSIPYTQSEVKCVSNGIEYFKGNLQVTKSDNVFKTNIKETIVDVFNLIKDKKLYEVDAIPPTAWNASDIDGFRTAITGVTAPVINWGDFDTATPSINPTLYLPSYFYSEIVLAILENTGFTFVGDVLTDADFTDLIIPFAGEQFEYVQQYQDERTFSATNSAPQVEVSPTGSPGSFKVDVIDTIVSEGSQEWYDTANSRWVIPNFSSSGNIGTARFSVYYDIDVEVGSPFPNMFVKVAVYKNGSEVFASIENLIDVNPSYNFKGTFGNTLPSQVAENIQDSDFFEVYIVFSDEASGTIDSITVNEIIFSGYVTRIPNRNLLFHNYLLPDIDQTDLLKDFFVRFGAVLNLESDGTTVTIKTWPELIGDKSNVPDWTTKRVRDRKDVIAFEYEGYAQSNYFNYDEGDGVPETLGRGNLPVVNENLEPEDDYFDSIFENCNTSPLELVEVNMAQIPVYDNTSTLISDFVNEPGLKLLTLRAKLSGEPAITFNATPRSDYKVAYFIDPTQSKDTGFQYFIDRRYSELEVSFEKTKLIERDYLLEVTDLMPPPPVIYDSGNYFLVNKIPKFIPNVTTEKVEILRVF